MKRIKLIPLAVTMLLAAPAFLTSCQEDAPEINYTMNVSVINDFTKVVEAIDRGSLKNEEAIAKLAAAIDRMNSDQQDKLQAIRDVLNSVNTTLETKLIAIEAALKAQTLSMEGKLDLIRGVLADQNTTLKTKLAAIEAAVKAQTLSLEGKLDLLEAAVKALPDYGSQLAAISTAIANLPDYGDKLSAIEAAVKALPDYGSKFDLIVASLDAIKGQAEALGTGQTGIATQIAGVTSAINALVDQVKDGDTDAAAALAQIIQKLEELKGSIGGGGTTPSPVEYVDLGLPSGLKWAKCNLGAPKPSEPGDHYAWGETDPKAEYTWATYKWMQAGQSEAKYITKYTIADGETGGIWYDSSGAFIGDNKTALVAADDAATAKLGSPWRMPTIDEFQELIDKCTWTWTTQDGVNGYQVDGPNGNAIFLPAGYLVIGSYRAGYYWSSSLSTTESDCAYSLDLNSDRYFIARTYRYFGCTVRPVRP